MNFRYPAFPLSFFSTVRERSSTIRWVRTLSHWFRKLNLYCSMNSRDPRIWVNGDYIPESRPVLSGTIRGLNYGAGCFETLRVDQGQTANLEEHIRRLHSGLSRSEEHTSELQSRGQLVCRLLLATKNR